MQTDYLSKTAADALTSKLHLKSCCLGLPRQGLKLCLSFYKQLIPHFENAFTMELEVLPIYEYFQKDTKRLEPFNLKVCRQLMQIFSITWAGEQKAWLGWCLDITLPSLLLASSFQLVEVSLLLAHPSTPSKAEMETLGAQRVRAREQIITSWSRQRDGSSSSHLAKANTILGSWRWQASLQTRSHMGQNSRWRKQNTRGVSRRQVNIW